MRRHVFVLACIALLPQMLAAQAERSSPATSGGSTLGATAPSFIPARVERIDQWVESLIAAKRIPGAVVMLVRDGRVEYHKAYGVRDLGTKTPMRTDDIFRIASQTKAITSLAIMMLWEEGRLQLDDPVEKYIPAFAKQTVLTKFNAADSSYEARPARRKTTIRQLLTHTSGLDYADIGSDEFKAIYAKAGVTAMGRESDVLEDRINVLAKLPLKQDPAERFTYSLSVDVLGRVVEVLSGMPLDRFFRTRILDPLRMHDTWFELPADKRSRLVALHQPNKDGVLEAAHQKQSGMDPDFPMRRVTYFSGGSGLSSTTADYARFLQLFLNGGELDGVRLLSRKTVELMLTNQVGALQPAFGLGFALETPEIDFRSPVSVGTFSWGGAFKTTYWADPKERLIGLIFTNMYGTDVDVGEPFKVLVYGAMR
ncbi:MAG: beta-lactamase family protein [Gemmatimonadaceae bacterium]|nr:beta-lactamase family protein [Gemmatimonadaceae bacterium]